ncbi:MAG TPA: hypothetical protein VEQ40_07775 [Pyrinomonadaceae bacterium]|nr:hypothetical protein [Pyrinomonadaceae bacterium]
MIERLKSHVEAESAARRIAELLAAHGEWLYVEGDKRPSALRRSECEARVAHGRLIFSCWSDAGARFWRVTSWEWTGEKLLLEATRRMGSESCKLELIPRAGASAALAEIGATRKEHCLQLAQLACAQLTNAKVERAGLSAGARRGQPGRYARILLRHGNQRVAVTGLITGADARERDAFLSSALVWFARLRERASAPVVQKLCLVVPMELAEPTTRHLALLRDDLRRSIKLYEIDDDWQTLTPARLPERAELWTASPRLRPSAKETELSRWARRLLELSPDAIDVVRARNGETLRFHGLAFARVRRLMNTERAWLGIEGERRRPLDESNWNECVELIEELKVHRSATAPDHRHAFYKSALEAWLESLLRRNITRLDPGLRIAPLHAQFRTAHDAHARATRPVDLLALRRDGRLVVIELKVTEDREHVLQGVDYWRRIEAYRRAGHIDRARLFGEAVISDTPPLVYLVAPLLRFHRSFHTLADSITPEIEMYRFDINEDWRAGVRAVRRERVN